MRHSPGLLGRRYGEMLRALNIVKEEDVLRALAEQEKSGEDLDTILHRTGVANAHKVLQSVSSHFGLETVDITKVTVSPEVLNVIPVRMIHRYNILPIAKDNGTLRIATADPLNYDAFDDIRLLLKCEVLPVLALSQDIKNAIKQYYGIGADTVESMMAEDQEVEVVGADQQADIEDLTEDASIIRFVNQIMSEAIMDRATDIHIEPFEDELRIRYRVDGILYEAAIPQTIRHYQAAVISRVKIMADMNIAEKRLPQDGRINIRSGGNEFDLRVSTVPTSYGESIVIRILNRSSTILTLEDLGMDKRALVIFNKLIARPHGIILVTGPTGSGKTTTLYAALAKLNSPDVKIITIEDPVEYQMRGVVQIQVIPKIGLTFASILRSLLRQDPDIMLVGETRDTETAEITIRTALTGHLVFSTLHTNDAAGAITRLLDMGIEPFLVASSVIGVMAQRLVRKICPYCKEAYKPEHDALIAMNIPRERWEQTEFYRGKGCEKCKFLGYRGRTGVFEIFPMNERIKELTVERASASVIKQQALKEGMTTLRQFGWEVVQQGITTVDEVLRVTQEEDY